MKLFGALKTITGSDINRTSVEIEIDQRSYVNGLAKPHDLSSTKRVTSPLPVLADVVFAKPDEPLLRPEIHAEYRAKVKGRGELRRATLIFRPARGKQIRMWADVGAKTLGGNGFVHLTF